MSEAINLNDDALNILMLGETGVGKSTWINAFANYMTFKTLDEGKENDPVCLIPTKFSLYDPNGSFQKQTIQFGSESSEESMEDGQSATQNTRAHVFTTPTGKIRIIDTPGIGDCRGPDQDKENFENVLRYISQLPRLHGICILFKSNVSRLTVSFRYCISELLTHLHRSAATNIVFCFTNSRAAFYTPGDTLPTLEVFLEELEKKHGVKISATAKTIFCLDNEAFRFLLACKQGIHFSDSDHENYRQSWAKSQAVTEALVRRVEQLPAHKLQDTVSINDARRIILTLAKPLADITSNIQLNKKLLEDQQEDLKRHDGNEKDLLTRVKLTQVGIETKPLGHPRTVCTAPAHVDTITIPNTEAKQTIYRTHCHVRCVLRNVQKEKVPEPALQNCKAMTESEGRKHCKQCSCPWDMHMHIDYEQTQVSIQVEDPLVKDKIAKNRGQKEILEAAQKAAKRKHVQLTKELTIMMAAGAEFAAFLKKNAIKPYNDAIEAYLEYAITEEERLVAFGKTNRFKLDTYKKNMLVYREQKRILDLAIQNETRSEISTDEVMNLVAGLENLPINGQTFKDLFNASVISGKSNFAYTENRYDAKNEKIKKTGPTFINMVNMVKDMWLKKLSSFFSR